MSDPATALVSLAASTLPAIIQSGSQRRAMQQAQEMAPPTLTLDEATDQAKGVLNPLYDQQLQDTLRQVDQHNLQRGFYGQLPGAALSRSTASEVERSRAGQIASLAQQMQGQSQQQALQQQQLAMQYALGQGAQRQNMWSNLLSTGTNLLGMYVGHEGRWPWQEKWWAQEEINPAKMTQDQFLSYLKNRNLQMPSSLTGDNFQFGKTEPSDYRLGWVSPRSFKL